jgi:hypothetical protein
MCVFVCVYVRECVCVHAHVLVNMEGEDQVWHSGVYCRKYHAGVCMHTSVYLYTCTHIIIYTCINERRAPDLAYGVCLGVYIGRVWCKQRCVDGPGVVNIHISIIICARYTRHAAATYCFEQCTL